MKKVSTIVAMRAKNFPEQTLTIGLDLGDRSSYYCVLDEAGRIVLEEKVATTPKALQAGLPPCRTAGLRWRLGCIRRG